MHGGGEGRRGAISLLVTDSSMQTTSPQGRNQEAGPLTQAEGEGVGVQNSVNSGHMRRVGGLGGVMSAGLTGHITIYYVSTELLKMLS